MQNTQQTVLYKLMAIASVALLVSMPAVIRADRYWGNSDGGLISDPANWSGGELPGLTEAARFNLDETYTVTFADSFTNGAVFMQAPGGTVTLNIGAANEYYADGNFKIENNNGSAALQVISGLLTAKSHFWMGDHSNNKPASALITGPSTKLRTINYDINIGGNGSDNLLTVANGATIAPKRHVILATKSSGSENRLVVTGPDTELVNTSGGIFIGQAGSDNEVVFENGAKAHVSGAAPGVGGSIRLGSNEGADRNRLVIRSGAVVTNDNQAGGTVSVYVGYKGDKNTMLVSDAEFYAHPQLYVGLEGSGNSLTVEEGAKVDANQHFYVGYNQVATNNTVLITGAGSSLNTYTYDIAVGVNGDNNSMTISDGATATSWRDVNLGFSPGQNTAAGSNNVLVVTGEGSSLYSLSEEASSSGSLLVGWKGSGNAAYIVDRGAFYGLNVGEWGGRSKIIIGHEAEATDNLLFVGTDALVTNREDIVVGLEGYGNRMVVSNGLVTAAQGLFIGEHGGDNEAIVMDGGTVIVKNNTALGRYSASSNNVMRVVNGNFKVGGHIYVQRDGILSVEGSDGSIEANRVQLTAGGGLGFVFDSNGVTTIECSSYVTYDETARLNIEADMFSKAGGGEVDLMTFSESVGGNMIPEENITVSPEGCIVTQTDNVLKVKVPSAAMTVIIIR